MWLPSWSPWLLVLKLRWSGTSFQWMTGGHLPPISSPAEGALKQGCGQMASLTSRFSASSLPWTGLKKEYKTYNMYLCNNDTSYLFVSIILLAKIHSAWLLVMDYSLFKQEPAQQMLGELTKTRWHGKTWQVDKLECASRRILSIIGGVFGIPLQTCQLSIFAGPQDCKYGPAGQAASFGTWDRKYQVSTAKNAGDSRHRKSSGGPLISSQFPWGSGGPRICRGKAASQHSMSMSKVYIIA